MHTKRADMRDAARLRLRALHGLPSPAEVEEALRRGYKLVIVGHLQVWIRDYSLDVSGEV